MASKQSLLKRIAGYVERNPLFDALITAFGDTLDTVRASVTSLSSSRESQALLTRRAKDRLLFFGGWETEAEQQTYLRTWYDVLKARGTRTGLQNELDRLVKGASGDPGVTITDITDYDVDISTDQQYPDAPGACLNAESMVLIQGTNNSLIRSEQDIQNLTVHHLTSVALISIFDWS